MSAGPRCSLHVGCLQELLHLPRWLKCRQVSPKAPLLLAPLHGNGARRLNHIRTCASHRVGPVRSKGVETSFFYLAHRLLPILRTASPMSTSTPAVPTSWGGGVGAAAAAAATVPQSPVFNRTHETVQDLRDQLTTEFGKLYGLIATIQGGLQGQTQLLDDCQKRVTTLELGMGEMGEAAKVTISSARSEFEGHRAAIMSLAQASTQELGQLKGELSSTQQQAQQEFQTQRAQLHDLQFQARDACTRLAEEVAKLQLNVDSAKAAVSTVAPGRDPWQAAAGQMAAGEAPPQSAEGAAPPGIQPPLQRPRAAQPQMYALDTTHEEQRVRPDIKVMQGMDKLQPECSLMSYHSWKRIAKSALTAGRPEVSALLQWAETQDAPITPDREYDGARAAGVTLDPAQASAAVFGALMHSIHKSILDSRCRLAGEDRGLELWRLLVQEHESRSPQAMLKKQRAFQHPNRCSDLKDLVRVLPAWLQLEKELDTWSPMGEGVKQVALQELLPLNLLADMRKNLALSDYPAELHWTKVQCQFVKDDELTASLGDDPMMVGALTEARSQGSSSVQQPSVPQDSSQVLLNALQGINASLLALGGKKGGKAGGKGQWPSTQQQSQGGGGGKGKGAWQQGGITTQSGNNPSKFDGICNYCHKYGHRKSECRQLDEVVRRAKAEKGGGKGAFKGGKATSKSLNELDNTGAQEEDECYDDAEWEAPTWMLGVLQKKQLAQPSPSIATGPIFFPMAAAPEEDEEAGDEMRGADDPIGPEGEPPLSAAPRSMGARQQCKGSCCVMPWSFREGMSLPAGPQLRTRARRMQRVKKWKSMDATPEVGSREQDNMLASVVRASQVQRESGGEAWRVIPSPKVLCPLKKPYDQLRPVELLVDSGAAESVIPPMELPDHPVIQNAASLSGEEYLTADGKTIPNKGEQKVSFRTQEGHRCALTFQVTDVTKPLLSATQLADTGREVMLRSMEV